MQRNLLQTPARSRILNSSRLSYSSSPLHQSPVPPIIYDQRFTGIRKDWHKPLARLLNTENAKYKLPQAFQTIAIELASYFTASKDLDFQFQRNFQDKFQYVAKEETFLGEGAFGKVYTATSLEDGREVAVKIIPKKVLVTRGDSQSLLLEHQILTQLGTIHPNIIQFRGAYEDEEEIFFVMEKCMHGHLGEYLGISTDAMAREKTVRGLEEIHIVSYVKQILQALAHCHEHGIVHGDIKFENFLCGGTDGQIIKLADFGSSMRIGVLQDQVLQEFQAEFRNRGTPIYTAPEILQGIPKTNITSAFASDMWSCGVMVYAMIAGTFPFPKGPLLEERIQYEPLNMNFNQLKTCWSPEARDFVEKLLCRNVSDRYTAIEALNHPWIVKYNS